MFGKLSAFLGTSANAVADFLLDEAVNQYNMYQVLYLMSFFTTLFELCFLPFMGFSMTKESLAISLFYAFTYFLGDYTYTKSLKTLPISVVGLLESGNLFLILICDLFLGYIKPNPMFFLLFFIFIGAVWVFTMETEKMKGKIEKKKIDLSGLVYLLISIIFYAATPYLIKFAQAKGGNELSISLTYNILAIPSFYYLYRKSQSKKKKKEHQNGTFWLNLLGMSFLFGIYMIAIMTSYNTESPIVIAIIEELRVFLLVILAVITKTDRMNKRKTISLFIGMASILLLSIIGG